MLIYTLIFFFLLIPVIRFDLMKIEGNKNLWFYSSLILLILLSGLRYRVGGDTLVYMRLFDKGPSIGELLTFNFQTAEFNPLWYIFNAPFVTLKSFTLFQIAHAVVVNITFFSFFRRYVPTAYFTAILVYYFGSFFYFNMEVLRETLCISVLLWAYPSLEKRRFVRYYLWCVVALFIHMSAAIMLVIPFTLLFRRDNIWISVFAMLSVILLLSVFDVISYGLSLAFEGTVAEKIHAYLLRDDPNIFGILLQFLTMLPFLLVTFVRNKNYYDNDKVIGAVLLLVVVLQTAGMFVAAFVRFTNYLVPFGIVFMVNTFYMHYWDLKKHLMTRMVMSFALCVYVFTLSYYYLRNRSEDYPGGRHYHLYVPYHSVFDPVEDERRETLVKNMRSGEVMVNF